MAVPRGDPGPSGEDDVAASFSAQGRRCAEAHSNAGEDTRVRGQRFTRRRLGLAAARSALGSVSRMRPTRPCRTLGRVLLDFGNRIRTGRRPSAQAVSQPSRPPRPPTLPGFDPSANEFAGELSQNSRSNRRVPRPSHSIRRGSLVKCSAADRVGAGEFSDPGGDLFQLAHERVAGPIGMNAPGLSASSIWPSSDPHRAEAFVSSPFPVFSSAISPSVYPGAGFADAHRPNRLQSSDRGPRLRRWLIIKRTQNPSRIVKRKAAANVLE